MLKVKIGMKTNKAGKNRGLHKYYPRIMLLVCTCVCISGCIQKRFSIEGKLLALASQTPLPQATLRLHNLINGTTHLITTDNDGKFAQDRLEAGKYKIVSADTMKFLISPDSFEIKSNGDKIQSVGTLRGLQSPTKTGVYAWVDHTWREIPLVRGGESGTLSRDLANQVVNIPESASLLVWLPGHSWGESREGINWVMATFTDSIAHFLDGELHERTPKGEPAPMDPTAFSSWNLPGVLPLRGPSSPNLYAIEVTSALPNGIIDRVLYPFWIPLPNGTLSSPTPQPITFDPFAAINSNAPVNPNGAVNPMAVVGQGGIPKLDSLPPGTQDLIQKVLSSTLAALGIKPQTGTPAASPPSPITTPNDTNGTSAIDQHALENAPKRTDITPEQATRWREAIRKARNDPDAYRRRQLWRAIRDSAEGSDIALEADKLLMRDINGLPLK